MEELSKLRTEDSTLKSLVFSQFTTMLDLIERRLQIGGYKTVRLSGTMSPLTRHNIITKFTNDSTVTVFLISLKAGQSILMVVVLSLLDADDMTLAGGVALNLTEASRVFREHSFDPKLSFQLTQAIRSDGSLVRYIKRLSSITDLSPIVQVESSGTSSFCLLREYLLIGMSRQVELQAMDRMYLVIFTTDARKVLTPDVSQPPDRPVPPSCRRPPHYRKQHRKSNP